MTKFYKQAFSGLKDIDTGTVLNGIECVECVFASSSLSMGSVPALRSIVRDSRFKDCRVRASFIGSAILNEVELDGLETGKEFFLQFSGAVYRHVVFRGKIERIQLSSRVGLMATAKVQAAFDEDNRAFYQNVDWALDVSGAEFYECSLLSVPPRLVRRDPETQVVVTREKAALFYPGSADISGTFYDYHLATMLKTPAEGVVLVAPKAHPNFLTYLRALQNLRAAGIAEAD